MFSTEVIKFAENKYNLNLSDLIIEDIKIGIFLTAVKLSNGGFGLALTNIANAPYVYRDERKFDAFIPGHIQGHNLNELFSLKNNTGIIQSLKASAMNALSASMINDADFKISYNTDPLDLLKIEKDKTVTVVGAFSSYIRKIQKCSCKLNVLELDKSAIRPESRKYFVPADKASEIIPQSDIVIITGSTIVNNTLHNLLDMTSHKAKVVVTGPSAGIYPEILFKRNVDLIGSVKINDEKKVMQVVQEGGTGFHLFRYGAEKITYINTSKKMK